MAWWGWGVLLVCGLLGFFLWLFFLHLVMVRDRRLSACEEIVVPKLQIPSSQNNVHVCYDRSELANILVIFCNSLRSAMI